MIEECTDKISLPKSGKACLASLRKYVINDNYVAAISDEDGSGWCIFKKEDYDRIIGFLRDNSNVEIMGLDASSKVVLNKLWESNLLYVDNKKIGIYSSADASVGANHDTVFLLIKLTSSCNFSCSYCYDFNSSNYGKVVDVGVPYETIKQFISMGRSINICFHGGEPLLQFELIKTIIDFTYNELKKSTLDRKKILFSIQTNGSLINDDIVSFCEDNDIRCGISLDGHTEKANSHRKNNCGNLTVLKSFLNNYEKYPSFIKKRCGVLGVLHKDSISEANDFIIWLQDLGVESIYFNFLHVNNFDTTGINRNLFGKSPSKQEIRAFYNDLYNNIVSGKINKISVGNIRFYIEALLYPKSTHMCYNKGPCGASTGQFLGINVDGKFITCDSIPEEVAIMRTSSSSTSEHGFYTDPARNFAKEIWNKFKISNCKNCALFGLCGGGCPGFAYLENRCSCPAESKCLSSKFVYGKLLEECVAGTRHLLKYYSSICKK